VFIERWKKPACSGVARRCWAFWQRDPRVDPIALRQDVVAFFEDGATSETPGLIRLPARTYNEPALREKFKSRKVRHLRHLWTRTAPHQPGIAGAHDRRHQTPRPDGDGRYIDHEVGLGHRRLTLLISEAEDSQSGMKTEPYKSSLTAKSIISLSCARNWKHSATFSARDRNRSDCSRVTNSGARIA